MRGFWITAAIIAATNVQPAFAAGDTIQITPPAEGSITKEEGLAAWARIYEVASHPRCSNCHTGASDRPMWSGPSYGKTRVHGMNIRAGDSRIGVEYIPCATCHVNNAATGHSNSIPHAAPQVAASWRLAPVEADWFGRSSIEICTQLRNPDLNGDRDMMALASHLDHDVILHWAWNPGGGREAAPYSLQEHVNDLLAWGTAGFPCEGDG